MTSISIKISILDKEYQVNCQTDERDALERSAELLNDKMSEIRHGSHIIGLERVAVMAALNISHDLIKAQNLASQDSGASDALESMDTKLNSVLSDLSS
jgi:cell division protein ZapA